MSESLVIVVTVMLIKVIVRVVVVIWMSPSGMSSAYL